MRQKKKNKDMDVKALETGMTILDFLAGRLGSSRRSAKNLLDSRNVLVNGSPVWMAKHKVKRGDLISIGANFSANTKNADPPEILFEDADYLIVNKPAGILTQGERGIETLMRPVTNNDRLVAVHRLDRDTSGCLIMAKRTAAFEAIIPIFASRDIKKIYRGIVHGYMQKKDYLFTEPIEGKEALTRMRVLDASAKASYIQAVIETGRTHQIRKHLAGAGHPIVGDRQYGLRGRNVISDNRITRQMLHSYIVEFKSPMTGRDIRVTARIPLDLKKCLIALKLE